MLLARSCAYGFQGAGFKLTVSNLHSDELKEVILNTVWQKYNQVRQLIHLVALVFFVTFEDCTGERVN